VSYTLVSATVLGFELAQLPRGPVVAQAVLTGLTADTGTLLRLAAGTRSRRSEPAPVIQLRSLPARLSSTSTIEDAVEMVRASRWDGALALERMVRHEVLGADCAALAALPPVTRKRIADVLVDTAVAAWADPGPRDRGGDSDVGAPDTGCHPARVQEVIAPLLTGDREIADGWRATAPADSDAWTQAMHQACWAAHLTGRVREAAAAQMLGVIAFRRAGLGPVDVATGTWTALSGVLQAGVVADLLDQESLTTLLAPTKHDITVSAALRSSP